MTNVVLGEWANGGSVRMDVSRLIETRALIQANSGGGKSYLLRKALEITHGHVQQIIIDPEGEFASLREHCDLIIAAARDADVVAHPKTARLLAIRLLETQASAVLDLSELKVGDRHALVRLFIEALIDAPKGLRHPVLIALDESHLFCPEKGQGESEATDAVIDLASRGRKRGLALLAATQRIGKFNKSAAAELKNKLIGGTGLDVDVKRAAFDLGMAPKDALTVLRALEAGHFYAFGPALNQVDPRELIVGPVETTHPKVGHKQHTAPPKPSEAIKALLPKLADLPREAEQELKTAEDLRRELVKVRRELTLAQKDRVAPSPEDLQASEVRGFQRGWRSCVETMRQRTEKFHADTADMLKSELAGARPENPERRVETHRPAVASQGSRTGTALAITRARQIDGRAPAKANGSSESLPKGQAATLAACIQFPDGLRREQLTVLTGYKRSSRDAYIQRLRERGFVDTTGDLIRASDAGIAALPDAEPLPTGPDLQAYWMQRLPEGERKILGMLIEHYPATVPRADLDARTGYQRSSRDAYLQRLRAKQLVTEPSRGEMRAAEDLFA